jgi:protein-S-isoprenylcysteine O-methyltransferase Ste14
MRDKGRQSRPKIMYREGIHENINLSKFTKKKMPAHSYFVLTAFICLFFVFAFTMIRLKKVSSEIVGTPAIDKLYFYSAKFAVFTTWALFILKAIFPRFGYISLPDGFSWTGVVLLYMGMTILSVSFFNLGNSLKVGLPSESTTLQTRGLFRISRNPLYVSVYMISAGSCFYFPDLINISFALYAIYMHHLIIRQEERFLSERFGTEWLIYSARVSRYI